MGDETALLASFLVACADGKDVHIEQPALTRAGAELQLTTGAKMLAYLAQKTVSDFSARAPETYRIDPVCIAYGFRFKEGRRTCYLAFCPNPRKAQNPKVKGWILKSLHEDDHDRPLLQSPFAGLRDLLGDDSKDK